MGRVLGAVLGAALAGTLMTGTATAATSGAPAGFTPSSSSWLTPERGWVLGYAPCGSGTPRCPSMLSTMDGGRHWHQAGAPPLAVPGNSDQVRVRFSTPLSAVATDGSRVVSTLDGGRHWSTVTLAGAPSGAYISAIAGTLLHSYAVASSHAGTQLYSGLRLQHHWSPVRGVAVTGDSFGDISTAGGLNVTIGQDYGVPQLWSSSNGLTWTRGAAPCPAAAVPALGGVVGGRTFVMCTSEPGRGESVKQLRSAPARGPFVDDGAAPPELGITEQAATPSAGTTVISAIGGGAAFLYATFDGGGTWTNPLVVDPDRPFFDLAFTGQRVGTVVSGGPSSYGASVLRTTDGGRTWTPLSFR